MEHTQSIAKLGKAMAAAQGEFKDAERDRDNPFFDSSYSTMAAVLAACRAALAKNGIGVFQATEDAGDEHIVVETVLTCEDEWLKTKLKVRVMPMVVDKGDQAQGVAKQKAVTAQAQGSASTYACRYALRSLLVIASEDDDGNAASGLKTGLGAFQDIITNVASETKKGRNNKMFTIFTISTAEHGDLKTFTEDLAKEAAKAKEAGQPVEIEGKKNDKGFGIDLVRIGAAGAQPVTQAPGPQRASVNGGGNGQAPAPGVKDVFMDTVEEVGSTQEANSGKIRYGVRTGRHGWASTYDEAMFKRAKAMCGSNIPAKMEVMVHGELSTLTHLRELTPEEMNKQGKAEGATA